MTKQFTLHLSKEKADFVKECYPSLVELSPLDNDLVCVTYNYYEFEDIGSIALKMLHLGQEYAEMQNRKFRYEKIEQDIKSLSKEINLFTKDISTSKP